MKLYVLELKCLRNELLVYPILQQLGKMLNREVICNQKLTSNYFLETNKER